jgi:hypothetical protein
MRLYGFLNKTILEAVRETYKRKKIDRLKCTLILKFLEVLDLSKHFATHRATEPVL